MIEPFYFGPESRRLFGAYHPPLQANGHDVGIVLCSPVGQEYIRTHRAFLQLARLLAKRGFFVLRFDYYGCGDSQGDCDQGSLRQWVADISTAVEELRGSGVRQTALVGLRLGATLALACGQERGDIDAMVCWEPVVSGGDYLREIGKLHDAWLAGSFARPRPHPSGIAAGEVLGFPLTESMQAEYQSCDLQTRTGMPARQVLIVSREDSLLCDGLAERLQAMGAQVSHTTVQHPRIWEKSDERESKGLVPVDVLERVGAWMSEVFP